MNLKTFEYERTYIENDEVKKEPRKATFYFSADVLVNLSSVGIKGMTELSNRMQEQDLGTFAKIGFLAHKTACRLKKEELTIESVDEMSDLIQSVGLVDFIEYAGMAIAEVMKIEIDGLSKSEKKNLVKSTSRKSGKQPIKAG